MSLQRTHEPVVGWSDHHQKWLVTVPGIPSIYCATEDQARAVAASDVPEELIERERQATQQIANAEHLAQIESAGRAEWEARARRAELRLAANERVDPREGVDPAVIGAVRRGPQGDGTARIDNAGSADWLMLVGGGRYTDEQVREWPVVGVVPGTPAAWFAGEPMPSRESED